MSNSILYQVEQNVANISINKAHRRNALNIETLALMQQAFKQAEADNAVKVVVLAGIGEGFCAGADLASNMAFESAQQLLEQHYKPTYLTIAELNKPVIACINGAAAGAGCALALLCDLMVMSEDAYLMMAFSNIGLVPDCGANWLLTNALGYQRAYQLAIEGGKLNSQACLQYGVCNKVFSDNRLVEQTQNWAQQLAKKSPLSMAYTKKLMRGAASQSYTEVFSQEAVYQNLCMASADFTEGLTAFYQKRDAVFTGS